MDDFRDTVSHQNGTDYWNQCHKQPSQDLPMKRDQDQTELELNSNQPKQHQCRLGHYIRESTFNLFYEDSTTLITNPDGDLRKNSQVQVCLKNINAKKKSSQRNICCSQIPEMYLIYQYKLLQQIKVENHVNRC